ncbi:hypothetical protein X949_5979 [Burkholderia pseudomallei MSHR5609]|nr:hypothetical protein X949_5979 [Burkholderia pseudomallei MSHR5609]
MAVNTPASIMPRKLAGRSKAGLSSRVIATASPSEAPSIRLIRNTAPPSGSRETITSCAGRVTSASSASAECSDVTGPSDRFIAKIETAGYGERTIRVAGCGTRRTAASASGGIAVNASAVSVDRSAA